MKPRLACVFALLGGCVIPVQPAPETGAAPAPATAAAGSLGCADVLQCMTTCTDQDCVAGCQASGSSEGQAMATAMLDCTTACGNEDDCIQRSCSTELSQCFASVGAPAVASADLPMQPHPNEGLLEWMTGDWIGTNHQFQFFGDGTVRRSSGVALYTDRGDMACVSVVNDLGTVVQEGDLFIMTFGTTDVNHCGDRSTEEAEVVRYQIQWFDNPYDDTEYLQLQLRELDCTRGGDMYCVDGMNRRK